MFIVDSQIHVWAASTPDRPWPAPGADGRSATPQREIPFGIDEALGLMDKAGIPITLMPHAWCWLVEQVAERHPGLKLCIDHMGCASSRRDAEAFTHMDALLRRARFPNIAVKSSALPCCSSAPYPWAWLHPQVKKTYDAFGPQRMFWGTDISRSPCGYRENVELFTRELSWLTATDLEWIMGRGVCEWYGWAMPR